MTKTIIPIKDKNGNVLTDEEVKQKLQKILHDICLVTSVEVRIEELFRRKCEEEFSGFKSVVCCFSTTPKIVNVYFHGREPITILV